MIHESHSSLFEEIHPSKNRKHTSSDMLELSEGSSKKLWWLGGCGHEWEAVVANRVRGSKCPYCTNQKVLSGFNDLATTHPEVAARWDYTKNAQGPQHFSHGSEEKVHWFGECGHEWVNSVYNESRKSACFYCTNQKVLSGFNDLATTHPEVTKLWHPTKNFVSASATTFGSNLKVWWLGKCGHEWERIVKKAAVKNNCPYCTNQKVFPGFNDLAATHPEVAKLWHPTKNEQPVSQQNPCSSNVRWWVCKKGHEWESAVRYVVDNLKCPYCSGRKVLPGFNDLATTHPALAEQWHPTLNQLSSSEITYGSGTAVWWQCSKGHEWFTTPNYRSLGRGCMKCWATSFVSEPEKQILQILPSSIAVITSARGVISKKEIDIYLPNQRIGIEYNGSYWHSEAAGKTKTYHYDKWLAAEKNNIHLINIWEDEWETQKEAIISAIVSQINLTPNSEPLKVLENETHFIIQRHDLAQPASWLKEEINNMTTETSKKALITVEHGHFQSKPLFYYIAAGFVISNTKPPQLTEKNGHKIWSSGSSTLVFRTPSE